MNFFHDDLSFWLSVVLVCSLGAMSPGPSLAVVMRHSIASGRRAGYIAAVSHGIGIGFYALITAVGLSVLIQQNQALFDVVQALGCLFLLYLAFKLVRSTDTAEENIDNVVAMTSHWHAFRDGLLIALISPKIMVFFTALFSQFVRVESGIGEKLGLAVVAGVVDVLWYLFIATLVTGSTSTEFFNRNGRWMNLLFGMILAIFALRFLGQIIGIW